MCLTKKNLGFENYENLKRRARRFCVLQIEVPSQLTTAVDKVKSKFLLAICR